MPLTLEDCQHKLSFSSSSFSVADMKCVKYDINTQSRHNALQIALATEAKDGCVKDLLLDRNALGFVPGSNRLPALVLRNDRTNWQQIQEEPSRLVAYGMIMFMLRELIISPLKIREVLIAPIVVIAGSRYVYSENN